MTNLIKVDPRAYECTKYDNKLQKLNDYITDQQFPYSYEKSLYFDDDTPLTIQCTLHEEFEVLPKKLLKTNQLPCPQCNKINKNHTHKKTVYNQQTFIDTCIQANGDRFDYSTIDFKGFNYNIYPKCHKHGTISVKNPATHLTYTTCPKCRGELKRYSTETFIQKAKELHGDLFDYTNSVYSSAREPIDIFCNYCKQTFTVNQAYFHLQGNGCNLCRRGGFDGTKPGVLYYISIDNGAAYKIGITNKSVKDRYSKSDLKRIQIIQEWKYEFGLEAFRREQEIIKNFKDSKYSGTISMESCSHKEMFNRDILLLDK